MLSVCCSPQKEASAGNLVLRGSGFISQPFAAVYTLRYWDLITLKYCFFRIDCHLPNKDAEILQTFIFFKSKQFKIGLPFHIFIQSGLMCPCLYYIFHPCHLWLSQHYEDVLQISINGNIKTLAIYQRSSRQVDLCYIHPQWNTSGIFHISLYRAIFLLYQR